MPFLSSGNQHVTVHQVPQQHHQSSPPPTHRKISVFTAFNRHADSCPRCKYPLEVMRRGDKLCDEGHEIAIDVARALYKLAGETVSKYQASENCHVALLVDLTKYDGPVYDLCKAMDKGLRKMSTAPRETAVHYAQPRRESTSSRSHDQYYTTVNSSTSSRRPQEEVPRRSGTIRINLPVEYGKEASFYEEFCHSNGGKIITKYYNPETPRPHLTRANTITEPSSSKPTRKSTVHFDPEVKYYT